MVNWQDIQILKVESAAERLSRRHPSFFARYAGHVDEFGFKFETFAFWIELFRFLFEDYFKVTFQGIENLPAEGRALIVGNHSGLLPFDGAMLTVASINLHSCPRRVRFLATDWFFSVPGLREWTMETGQVRGTLENAKRLLELGEIVGIYPEGLRGVGKTYRERYRVYDFHPGFVQLAISTQTPITPIATVGGDEILPNFVNLKTIAQLLKMPFFPVTLAFPWLPFPLMFIPLPVRWLMKVHKPIDLGYPPERANDRKLVLRICKEIQHLVQKDINELLRERKSVFAGWDNED